MKTAFVRCETFSKIDKNGKSRSLISAAAYVTGSRMYDDQSKKFYNYSRKKEVISAQMFWAGDAEKYFKSDAQKYFSVLQKSDKKPNSRLAKKYVLALPNELSQNAAEDLMVKMSRHFTDVGLTALGAIHWQTGNYHIHFLVSDKVFKNGSFQRKNANKNEYQLDESGQKIPIIDPKTGKQKTRKRQKNGKTYEEKCWKRTGSHRFVDSKDFLQQFKAHFVTEANRLLAQEGHEMRISVQNDNELEPEIHIGAAAWELHRKGLYSSRYEQNERIKMRNRSKAPKPTYKPSEEEKIGMEILRGMAAGKDIKDILNDFAAKELAAGGTGAQNRIMMANKQITSGKLCLPLPAEFLTADKKQLDISKIKADPKGFKKSIAKLQAKRDGEMVGNMVASLVPIPGVKSILRKAVSEAAQGVLKASYSSRQGSSAQGGQGLKSIKDTITGQKDAHTQLVASANKQELTDDWFWLSEFQKDEKREEMARKRMY